MDAIKETKSLPNWLAVIGNFIFPVWMAYLEYLRAYAPKVICEYIELEMGCVEYSWVGDTSEWLLVALWFLIIYCVYSVCSKELNKIGIAGLLLCVLQAGTLSAIVYFFGGGLCT